MTDIFISLVNMSMTSGWLILAVMAARLVLKRAPKFICCILWCLVGIRLVIPFSVESTFSLVPGKAVISAEMMHSASPAIDTGIDVVDRAMNPIITENFAKMSGNHVNPMQTVMITGSYIWIAGVILLALYTVGTYIRLRMRVCDAVRMTYDECCFIGGSSGMVSQEHPGGSSRIVSRKHPVRSESGRVFQSERVTTPFVLGMVKPAIYIPFYLTEEEQECVIAHETAHIKRGDHLVKPIAFAILTVYWFNPMVWIAYVLLCKDIELACDEKVLREMGLDKKKVYSRTLLNCSVKHHMIAACPLAFGEAGVKMRIKNIVNYKKPTFLAALLSVAVIVVVAVCFMTNPKEPEEQKVVLSETGEDITMAEPESKEVMEKSEIDAEAETEKQEAVAAEMQFRLPVEGTVSAPFGESPNGVMHEGIDIAAEEGTEIFASADGTVLDAGFNPSEGNFVIIEHDNGYWSLYAHCEEVLVEKGDEVTSGTQIATVGKTGNATGAHLHFEVRRDETELIDPGLVIEPAE